MFSTELYLDVRQQDGLQYTQRPQLPPSIIVPMKHSVLGLCRGCLAGGEAAIGIDSILTLPVGSPQEASQECHTGSNRFPGRRNAVPPLSLAIPKFYCAYTEEKPFINLAGFPNTVIMPPKKADKAAGGVAKKAIKTVEDRTFGMKNKKGASAQKTIAAMTTNLKNSGSVEEKRKAAEKAAREREKKAAEDAKREAEALLNRPAQIQKVPFGVDPKTVFCIFYKKGNCEKGKKCKFSHDLEMERKTEKRSVYQDIRQDEDEKEKKKAETSADWDEEKLRSVVLSKKGNQRTTTDKVCKYFIEAIEDGKYGWFWICPNSGDKCMYKHALPPGFVLKTKEQRAAEKALMDKSPIKTLTLEEFLESERHKLTGTLTPVTPESFAKWKKERLSQKAAEEEARKAKEATGRGDDDDVWNLQKLRRETEALQLKKEEDRLAALQGLPVSNGVPTEGLEANDHAEEATISPVLQDHLCWSCHHLSVVEERQATHSVSFDLAIRFARVRVICDCARALDHAVNDHVGDVYALRRKLPGQRLAQDAVAPVMIMVGGRGDSSTASSRPGMTIGAKLKSEDICHAGW
ncbi:hypothetical protein P8C59_006186 [Phyllachora maydis]|uniref:C3H1-type domain-containing protein n=1 Tax=Phyllachora maydis TaxID=1825666 RepID=A0AAD9MGD4_9PEZI|nr:hypothetical protein P8C59_006186 [Phyllachora maydis]